MEAKMASILMLDPTGEWLELRASFGAGQAYLKKPRLRLDDSFLGIVFRRKKPMQLENVQSSALYQNVDMARREGLVSLLSAPLVFGGQAIGTLNVYTGAARSFSNEEIHILRALAELSAIAMEKARLYERIVDVEEQLRQNEKFSALGLLAAEVAHEIRNPLTVMKMLYHSLRLDFPPGDPRVKDDAILREKMEHLNKIVEQILDFARSTEPNLGAVNVNQLLDDLGLLTRHKMRNQGIQLSAGWSRTCRRSWPTPPNWRRPFSTYVLNAVEAMPAGGTLTISTRSFRLPRASPKPTHLLIEFKDTGRGMPEEQRRRAFTSFLRHHQTARDRIGTGHRGAGDRDPSRQDENPLPSRQRHHLHHHPARQVGQAKAGQAKVGRAVPCPPQGFELGSNVAPPSGGGQSRRAGSPTNHDGRIVGAGLFAFKFRFVRVKLET